jgi:hypothetical protein
MTTFSVFIVLLALEGTVRSAFALQPNTPPSPPTNTYSRRSWLCETVLPSSATSAIALGTFWNTLLITGATVSPAGAAGDNLVFSKSASGIEWADSKVGTGPTKAMGQPAAIDYVMSTTGARYGAKIYSTVEKNTPYRWTLGDGSTIQGLEEAIVGGNGIPPMQAGGIRRLVVPANLAYASLAKPTSGRKPDDECQSGVGVGPIPPGSQAFEEFQRFKNIYCNPNRQYQPDLVIDIKLYGKRN